MKLVTLEEFVKLPAGTIYSHYAPSYCTGLYRKGENVGDPAGSGYADFYEFSLLADCRNGQLPPVIDQSPTRWALFDFNAQFAVYEPADLADLLEGITGEMPHPRALLPARR